MSEKRTHGLSSEMVIKVDGEDYRLTLSGEQDRQKIRDLAFLVDAEISKLREKLPKLGYPQLLILALLRFAERLDEKGDVQIEDNIVESKWKEERDQLRLEISSIREKWSKDRERVLRELVSLEKKLKESEDVLEKPNTQKVNSENLEAPRE